MISDAANSLSASGTGKSNTKNGSSANSGILAQVVTGTEHVSHLMTRVEEPYEKPFSVFSKKDSFDVENVAAVAGCLANCGGLAIR